MNVCGPTQGQSLSVDIIGLAASFLKDEPTQADSSFLRIVQALLCKLELYPVQSSKYDDDATSSDIWRTLLSSDTLAKFHALTEDSKTRRSLSFSPGNGWHVGAQTDDRLTP